MGLKKWLAWLTGLSGTEKSPSQKTLKPIEAPLPADKGKFLPIMEANEGLTELSVRIIEQARAQAKHLNHSEVCPEHLFLAILSEPRCLAVRLLAGLGLSYEKLESLIREHVPAGGGSPLSGSIPFSDNFQKIMGFAVDEAHHFSANYIGSEHLLLGLVKDLAGSPAQALESSGIDRVMLRRALVEALELNMPQSEENLSAEHRHMIQLLTEVRDILHISRTPSSKANLR